MVKELHSIKKFRGTNLGILRLNKLAKQRAMKIKIGAEECVPISFDTYGHPIISEGSYKYYLALKAIKERNGESLVPEVEYEPDVFVIKKELYDSKKGITKIADFSEDNQLSKLKEILQNRKKAYFIGEELSTFILYGKYALCSNGHIYMCKCRIDRSKDRTLKLSKVTKLKLVDKEGHIPASKGRSKDSIVFKLSEVTDFELLYEVHIPGPKDRCAICGKSFSIEDVKNCNTTENDECQKVHVECLRKCTEAVNYKIASRIIDTVYMEHSPSEVINEDEKVWYKYHTKQGDVALRFKNKVIEIKWFGNFRPFNLESLFKDEDVTKKRLEDAKVIHAWGPEDAVRYLSMVAKL